MFSDLPGQENFNDFDLESTNYLDGLILAPIHSIRNLSLLGLEYQECLRSVPLLSLFWFLTLKTEEFINRKKSWSRTVIRLPVS